MATIGSKKRKRQEGGENYVTMYFIIQGGAKLLGNSGNTLLELY